MILKFLNAVLKFELPSARFLNFPLNSAPPSLTEQFLIIRDCMY